MMMNCIVDIVDDLPGLLAILPRVLSEYLDQLPEKASLSEIVLDLGYKPEIRYDKQVHKIQHLPEITQKDITMAVQKVGAFNSDNRAGIERTLHRISAIRNRNGKIIGLTCRVGRAVVGTIEIIRDIIESGKNILFLGPPGIGKTTKLRETARVLSDDFHKRVIVVDTSNEIAGDGDIPHPGIGLARRMQVPSPNKQHAVMSEAVENHAPEVIIVDEIGTEEEASAARTIAERGVQLVATAHGHNLENLIKNPTLSDLLGGIQSVILGDEEAKYRGTQKTVLERRSLPTFEALIEIRERDVFAIYHDVKSSVDALLRGFEVNPEIRKRSDENKSELETPIKEFSISMETPSLSTEVLSIFPYGISVDTVYKAIHALRVSAYVSQTLSEADIVLTVRSKLRSKSKIAQILQGRYIPVHVLKRNSTSHMVKFLRNHFQIPDMDSEQYEESILEIQKICQRVKEEGRFLDASPRGAYLRRIQHQETEKFSLNSMSVGEEPNRRVRVYPKQ